MVDTKNRGPRTLHLRDSIEGTHVNPCFREPYGFFVRGWQQNKNGSDRNILEIALKGHTGIIVSPDGQHKRSSENTVSNVWRVIDSFTNQLHFVEALRENYDLYV